MPRRAGRLQACAHSGVRVSDPPKPRRELFIWWTSRAEASLVGPVAPEKLPDYVRAQYADRYLFDRGNGSLYVDPKFGVRTITEWSPTMIATMIKEGTSAGIVFVDSDLGAFKGVQGLVTDFKLRVVVI